MTRELKLALILGSSLVLVVGVLISDHLSGARDARIARVDPPLVAAPVEQMPPLTAGRPRTEPQLAGADSLTISPTDQSFNEPRMALGDPISPTLENSTASNNSTLAQFADWARQQGAAFEPVEEFAAAETDLMQRPHELVMGQPVAPKEAAENATKNNAPTSTSQTAEYTVQAGDTLWQLAAKYLGDGRRNTELAAMNAGRLGPNGELRVGTKIRVPTAAGATTPPPAATKPEPKKPASTPSGKTYTVKAGDTLRKIAGKTLGSESRWKELFENNRSQIKDPDALRVGATLKIPST